MVRDIRRPLEDKVQRLGYLAAPQADSIPGYTTSTNTELLVSLLYADFISFKHMPRSGVLLFCFLYMWKLEVKAA